MLINDTKFDAIKNLVYSEGRLLERKLFQYFFEDGSKEACIKALLAYQNDDGAFGNGIEPDLLTPSSNGIGTETALYIMDILDYPDKDILSRISDWLSKNINDQGYIHHPPANLKEYPHQPWWGNPDNERVLSIAGLLEKLGVNSGYAENKILDYAMQISMPSKIEFYSYPFFIYAVYNKNFPKRQTIIEQFMKDFEVFLEQSANHYPLFGRYWYHAIPFISDAIVDKCAKVFIDSIKENGSVVNPYPQLPKWDSLFTLDGLMVLKKYKKI